MAFTDFLFSGSPPPSTSSTTSQQGSMPQWYNQYLASLANRATSVADQPYQSYDGPRVAPVDPMQQQGFDFLGANATNWQGPLDQAQSMTQQAGSGFNADKFNQYLSPYTSGVTDEIARLGNRNLTENLLPDLNSQFIGAGGFGSKRNMDTAEHLVRDTGEDIRGQQAMSLNNAYTSAMGNYLTGNQQSINAGQNLGGLAQMQQGLTTGTAGALESAGATNRGIGQQNLDVAYQDFQNQTNFPRANTAFLGGALQGNQMSQSTNTTTTAPYNGSAMTASPLAQFAGMYGLGKGAGVFRRGGAVPGFRRGGNVSPLSMVTMHERMASGRPYALGGRVVPFRLSRRVGGLEGLRRAA